MQSRMEKYNINNTSGSRTQKNKELYESVKESGFYDFDINSNVSIIEDNAEVIDVNRVKHILDEKYDSKEEKKNIFRSNFDEPVVDDINMDTKEYDINAFLSKAKQGKNIDYNKERYKALREAQYDILNNLDLELKKVEEASSINRKKEEENLMNLINTITELEIKNKTESVPVNKETHFFTEMIDTNTITKQSDLIENVDDIEKKEEKIESISDKLSSNDDGITKTLAKMDIDLKEYDDFKDVSRRDGGSIILKIIIFVVIIGLIAGAVYIIDNVLDLGLF